MIRLKNKRVKNTGSGDQAKSENGEGKWKGEV